MIRSVHYDWYEYYAAITKLFIGSDALTRVAVNFSGWVLMLNGAAVSWKTMEVQTPAHCGIADSSVVHKVIYLRNFLNNLGFPQSSPIYADTE